MTDLSKKYRAVIDRMHLYARLQLRRWPKCSDIEPNDLVNEAIECAFSRKNEWEVKEDHPDLQELERIMRNRIDHALQKMNRKAKVRRTDSLDAILQKTPNMPLFHDPREDLRLPLAAVNPHALQGPEQEIYFQQVMLRAQMKTGKDQEGHEVLNCMLNGTEKLEQIAEALNISVPKARNAKKRLRRKMKELSKEIEPSRSTSLEQEQTPDEE